MIRRRGHRRLAAAVALGCALAPAIAPTSAIAADRKADRAAAELAQFHARDQMLQDIGWQLVTGNAPFCGDAQPSVGLQMVDMAVFADPAAMRSALGLTGDFAVQTAAAGSPAASLPADTEIIALEGESLANWPAAPASHWQRLARLHDAIDAGLAATGTVSLTRADGSVAVLDAVPACPTRFELASGHGRALAEGKRVILGEKFAGFGYPREELAAAIAHELAHNLLGHRAWLDRHGRERRNVRAAEREADRMMPWLLANSGYDPAAALRFMQNWGPNDSAGLFRARSHEGWDERAEHIAAELARLAAAPIDPRGSMSAKDWSAHFQRELAEDGSLRPLTVAR